MVRTFVWHSYSLKEKQVDIEEFTSDLFKSDRKYPKILLMSTHMYKTQIKEVRLTC